MESQSEGEMFGPLVWSARDDGVGNGRGFNIVKRRPEMNARGFNGDSLTGIMSDLSCSKFLFDVRGIVVVFHRMHIFEVQHFRYVVFLCLFY